MTKNPDFYNEKLDVGYKNYKDEIFDAVFLIYEYYLTQLLSRKILEELYKKNKAVKVKPIKPNKLKHWLAPPLIKSTAFTCIIKLAGKIYSVQKYGNLSVLVVEHVLINRWNDLNNKFFNTVPGQPEIP